jgi:4-amino-4-deoxy-L-arabinose transferase-like glycosyltransferase
MSNVVSLRAPAPQAAASRALLGFIIAITIARLVFAAIIPLTEDEAYYRLWASSLQFGYYDHPPMIAWWIRAGMAVAGDNPLGVRLLPALSSGLTSLVVFDLAQRLGASAKVGERAAIWFNATLLIAAGGFLATPDAAAVPFWTLAVWCLARTTADKSAGWWLGAGAMAGLACISKYSSLFLAPGVLIWLWLRPGGLKVLRTPWPWLAGLIAAAIFGANVEWNATHHWAAFEKQFGRAAPGRLAPQFLLELIAGQLLLLNPAIAWFTIKGVGGAWRNRAGKFAGADLTLLLSTCAPFIAYLLLHSLHDRVQAHWPAPLYPALALIAAVAAESAPLRGFQAILKRIATPLGLGLVALVMLHAALPITDLKGVRDPAQEVRGWPDFAGRVQALRQTDHAAWIGTMSYGTTGQLAAQWRPQVEVHDNLGGVSTQTQMPVTAPPILELIERGRYPQGEQSWSANLTQPGIVVDLDRRLNAADLHRCFANVTPAGEIMRGKEGYKPVGYAAFLVSGPTRDVLHQGCW